MERTEPVHGALAESPFLQRGVYLCGSRGSWRRGDRLFAAVYAWGDAEKARGSHDPADPVTFSLKGRARAINIALAIAICGIGIHA